MIIFIHLIVLLLFWGFRTLYLLLYHQTLNTLDGSNLLIISKTNLSGVDAPEVSPNLFTSFNHSSLISSNELIR